MAEATWIEKVGWPKYHAMAMANVSWLSDEMVWVSQTSRKVFSFEWVSDSTEEAIRMAAEEPLDENETRLWFTRVPDQETIHRLKGKLGW